MTAAELAFVRRLRTRGSQLAPDLARRELAVYEAIRDLLTDRELVEAIESGRLDQLIAEILESDDEPYARLRLRVDRALLDATRNEARYGLPSMLQARVFGVFNPLVVEAARSLDTRVVQGIKAEVLQTVMQAAEDGLREGSGPRTVARRIRASIGLAPNQEAAVANFRRMLQSSDVAALTRKLRDRRYDATLRKAFSSGGLSRDQIERMTDAYRRRFIAHNAETHARTLALDTQKQAQRLAWRDAIDRGVVSRDDLVRTWVAVGGPHGDGRNRPEHLALHGTQAGFDEPFPNGELEPGESTYNCRCLARVTLKAHALRRAA